MRLDTATWLEVEKYLRSNDVLVLPVGSTEQHGPIGLIGTDYLCAEVIAEEVGKKLDVMVAPPICYGVSSHHMAFPGTATIRPSVYQAFLVETLSSFYQHGFRKFHIVNGHGGNEPCIKAAMQELKHDGFDGATMFFYNWWKLPEVVELAKKLYGEAEGHHATPSELSVTYFLNHIDRRDCKFEDVGGDCPFPPNAFEMRKFYPTGVMRSHSSLARGEHGREFIDLAASVIAKAIETAPTLNFD